MGHGIIPFPDNQYHRIFVACQIAMALNDVKQGELSALIGSIIDDDHLSREAHDTLLLAINRQEKNASKLLQSRFDASLIIDKTLSRNRSIYRVMLKVVEVFNHPKQTEPGTSVIQTPVISLFDTDDLKKVREEALLLRNILVQTRAGEAHSTNVTTVRLSSQDVRSTKAPITASETHPVAEAHPQYSHSQNENDS